MAKVYIDTSVVIALANPEDEFHASSVAFIVRLKNLGIPSLIGPAFLLEMAKAAELRGTQPVLHLFWTIEEHNVELIRSWDDELWSLLDGYISLRVMDTKRTLDLLHYASATLLGCTHLASWDRRHFNSAIEKRVNRVNSSRGLTTLKVGDPIAVARYLGIG